MDAPTWWHDDDRLMAELTEAVLALREVPEEFKRAGKDAFPWRTIDAELAQLRIETSLGEPEAAGMRGEARDLPGKRSGPRVLSFVADALTIELEIHPDAIRGQIVSAQPGTVRVRDVDGSVRGFDIDDVGWFVIQPVPAGRFQLHVHTELSVSVVTDWITP